MRVMTLATSMIKRAMSNADLLASLSFIARLVICSLLIVNQDVQVFFKI